MKYTLLLSGLFFFQLSIFAQLKQKMADDLFLRKEYYECVDMYKELANKTIRGKGVENLENVRRAAISNYKLFKMKESIEYFDFLDKKNNLNEQDREYYIQALRFIDRYSTAEKLIENSINLYPNNIYFNKLKNELQNFNALFIDSSNAKVNKTKIVSEYGDFAPSYYQDGLIYATKSKNTEVLNGRCKWDNSYYVSLLQSKIVNENNVENGKLLKKQFLTKAHDGPVAFTRDEQKLVITKNIQGKRKGKDVVVLALYFSEMQNGKWSDLVPFEYNNPSYSVGHGCFSDDGQTLYFISDMEGGLGQTDIYKSEYVRGKWSEPVNLGPRFNTNMQEMFPYVLGDKIYFASNGHFGLGGLDIFEADLVGNANPSNLGYPINTSADDFALICKESKNGINGYFSSNRESMIDGIYSFEKSFSQVELIVNVFEKYDVNELVPQHPVKVINNNSGEIQEFYTNNEGKLHIKLIKNQEYILKTEKIDFNLLKEEYVKLENVNKDSVIQKDLFLIPQKITIALRVTAKDTKKPLEDSKVIITLPITQKDTSLVTNEHGLATIDVDRNAEYWAHASKKGYIDNEKKFSTYNQNGKIIDLELEMTPIKKGEKFKLENIFYDLNKSTLRPESMQALDKLAEFIMKNNLEIELSSHTDSRGSDAYNLKLSQARAQSCVDYLLTKGVKPSQIKAKGYGETQLVNKCKNGVKCSEEEHQENRRTEVKILNFKN